MYSTYRALGRQLGRDISLSEFCHVIAEAIERDVLRMWCVDVQSGDRTELFEVAPDLEDRYEAESVVDARYDPFGLSLTPGRAADVEAAPEWEFNLDFEARVFEVTAIPERQDEALDVRRAPPGAYPAASDTHGLCGPTGP